MSFSPGTAKVRGCGLRTLGWDSVMQLSGLDNIICDGLASSLASHTENSMYVADCMTACRIIGMRLVNNVNNRSPKRQPRCCSPLGYHTQFPSPCAIAYRRLPGKWRLVNKLPF